MTQASESNLIRFVFIYRYIKLKINNATYLFPFMVKLENIQDCRIDLDGYCTEKLGFGEKLFTF